MSESGLDLGLADASRAGVFFVTAEDIATLDAAGRDAGLTTRRLDLSGSGGKRTLMLRFSLALDFPSGSGHNWDALTDSLRDLSWLTESTGFLLLLENAGDLRDNSEPDFEMLLDILNESALYWAEQDVPFWAFLALPEQDFSELS